MEGAGGAGCLGLTEGARLVLEGERRVRCREPRWVEGDRGMVGGGVGRSEETNACVCRAHGARQTNETGASSKI